MSLWMKSLYFLKCDHSNESCLADYFSYCDALCFTIFCKVKFKRFFFKSSFAEIGPALIGLKGVSPWLL